MYRRISIPIWNVADEESMKRLITTQPPTLQRMILKQLVSGFPRGIYFSKSKSSEQEPSKRKTLADFEKQILQGTSSSVTFDDSDSDYSDEEFSNEEVYQAVYNRSLVTLSDIPAPLMTELFHAILRRYGVRLDLEEIFGHEKAKIQGLRIPHRFQLKNTRADSKAESLVVTLGSIVNSFSYLDLSACTLSGESLEALSPRLGNVIELNLSRCSGIMEWGFLLSLRENLRNLNLSNLVQCGNNQQLCAMIAGLEQLQILDL